MSRSTSPRPSAAARHPYWAMRTNSSGASTIGDAGVAAWSRPTAAARRAPGNHFAMSSAHIIEPEALRCAEGDKAERTAQDATEDQGPRAPAVGKGARQRLHHAPDHHGQGKRQHGRAARPVELLEEGGQQQAIGRKRERGHNGAQQRPIQDRRADPGVVRSSFLLLANTVAWASAAPNGPRAV